MISTYDWFGYEIPIEDRYRLIKSVGFDGVLLWWSDGFGRGNEYREGVRLARNADLFIENIHSPIQNQNDLSLATLDGEDAINSKQIGFCYDSCHHANNKIAGDLLEKYGNRLMALHLHDNGGARGQHHLPLDGNINWSTVMKKIAETSYKGATALEPMNWGYEDMSINEFLNKAFENAKKLESLRFE